MRKSRKVKRRKLPCTIAVEISREELTIVVVHKRDDGTRHVEGMQTRWLRQAATLNSDQGAAELMSALAELVEKHKLTGGTVNVALSGDFCVTRVLAGETDKMLSELRSLRDRSAHYLSLGAGPKAVCESVRALDLKNSQGWLTVTNRETLDRIVYAIEGAGLFLGVIEHSMVAISRAVGGMGGDSASPVIVVEPGERGVDLGISYKGQLLFDYRPGGIHSKEHVAAIVEKHLERIQRYSTRFFRFAGGQINRVYLVGQREHSEFVQSQFAGSTRLTAEVLTPMVICPDWHFDDWLVANPYFSAALGSALVEMPEGSSQTKVESPNLLEVYLAENREPLWPLLRRHFWPVAAAAAVALLVYGVAFEKHRQAGVLERELASAESDSAQARLIRLEMDSTIVRERCLKVLDSELVNPPLHQLMEAIVRNKPMGVYLKRITLDSDSNILFLGTADSTEFVYTFQDKLKTIPVLENLAIAGMTPERIPTNENATGFTIRCKFAGYNGSAEGKGKNG
jgi:hypothetical protein